MFVNDPGNWSAPSNRGSWKSTDGGHTWRRTYAPGGAFAYLRPVVFSSGFQQDGTMFLAKLGRGTFVGIMKSIDAGETWADANTGMAVPALAFDPMLEISPQFPTDGTLFTDALGSLGSAPGFYKSTNGAASWTLINGSDASALAPSPTYLNDQTLVYAAKGDFHVSHDGGLTGQPAWFDTVQYPAVVGIRSVPSTTSRLANIPESLEFWAVARTGIDDYCRLYRSQDEGQTWEAQPLFELSPKAYLTWVAK
jgi:photosystem II stability/assembly factor-like uncharacterized protein